MGRFSFIGVRPRTVLRWSLGDDGDPYALAQEELGRRRAPVQVPGLEPPFAGGAVGFFAYDLVRTVEPLGAPNPDPLGLPGPRAHVHRLARRVRPSAATPSPCSPMSRPGSVWRSPTPRRRGASPRSAGAARRPRAPRRAGPRAARAHRALLEHEPGAVRVDGGADHRVHLRRRRLPGRALPALVGAEVPVEAFSIYRGLRAVNPSPYMYFLDFGDFEIAGASPEPLITVAGRRVATRPIAGTRAARGHRRGGRADRGRSCSPTRRSAPST